MDVKKKLEKLPPLDIEINDNPVLRAVLEEKSLYNTFEDIRGSFEKFVNVDDRIAMRLKSYEAKGV